MIQLKRCNVTIMVSDMDRAVRFYTENMGMQLKKRYGNHYAELEAPGLALGLHPAAGSVKWGNNLSIGFGVENLEQEVEKLNSAGVEVLLVRDGFGLMAHLEDPDGNALYLVEVGA